MPEGVNEIVSPKPNISINNHDTQKTDDVSVFFLLREIHLMCHHPGLKAVEQLKLLAIYGNVLFSLREKYY